MIVTEWVCKRSGETKGRAFAVTRSFSSSSRKRASGTHVVFMISFLNFLHQLEQDSSSFSGNSPWPSDYSVSLEVKLVKVKSLSGVRLFVTPWTVAYQAPPSMGFSRQEYWSGLPFPSPGDLPDPGIEPGSPAFQADSLTSEPPGKPHWGLAGVLCLSSQLSQRAASPAPRGKAEQCWSCAHLLYTQLEPGQWEQCLVANAYPES